MVFTFDNSITHITRLIAIGFSILSHTSFAASPDNEGELMEKYKDFLSELKNGESGLIIVSDNTCGLCIEASSENFQDSLSKVNSTGVFYLNAASEFGQDFSMKFRIHRRPAFLVVDSVGQILKKSYTFPHNENEMQNLVTVEDTLPLVKNPLDFDSSEYPDFYKSSFRTSSFRQPGKSEFGAFLEKSGDVTNPVTWSVISRFSVEDSIISKVIENKDELISKFGKQEVEAKFNDHLYEMIKKAVRNGNASVHDITDQCYRMFEGSESRECSVKFKSYYYQLQGDWHSFVAFGNELAMDKEGNRLQLISMAETLLRAGVDEEKLTSAITWLKRPTGKMNLRELEVVAALSYRTGLQEEAKEMAKAAVLRAESPEDEVPSSVQILEELER